MSQSWRVCVDFGTALSKAAAAPVGNTDASAVRPLAIAKGLAAANPFLAPCALFVGERGLHFGPAALARVTELVEKRREAMLSFKTILGAADLEGALALRAPRAIDPHGTFDRRGLVVLFLAWLLSLVDDAIARDPVVQIEPGALRIRYSRPGWHTQALPNSHRVVARLFDEARAIANQAGSALKAPGGIGLDEARSLVTAVRGASLPNTVDGCLLEAVAAAACHAMTGEKRAVWLVLDMGAGTTDIAALELAGGAVREIPQARRTLSAAGDALDRILLDMFVTKARNAKTVEQQSALWRRTLLTVREQKEGVFADGKSSLRYDGKVATVKRSDVESDRDFKDFRRALEQGFEASLMQAAAAADALGCAKVSIVLAGGGANLGFVQDIARKAKTGKAKAKASVQPTVPAWTGADVYQGQLAPVFSQLAIAMGGALAPTGLVTVQVDETAAA